MSRCQAPQTFRTPERLFVFREIWAILQIRIFTSDTINVDLVDPEAVLVLDRNLLQDGLAHAGLPIPAQRLPPTVTAVRGAEGGGVTYPLLPQLDLHHGTVAVAQLEDVQVVLRVDVLLHGAVLSRHGNHAGKGTQLCKSTL